jgi:hypothetical protein
MHKKRLWAHSSPLIVRNSSRFNTQLKGLSISKFYFIYFTTYEIPKSISWMGFVPLADEKRHSVRFVVSHRGYPETTKSFTTDHNNLICRNVVSSYTFEKRAQHLPSGVSYFTLTNEIITVFFTMEQQPLVRQSSSLSRIHNHTQDTPRSVGLL